MNALASTTEGPSETLPLFPEASLDLCDRASAALIGSAAGSGRRSETTDAAQPRTRARKRSQRRRGQVESNPHLAAAKRLSRKIRYLPDHSEAQSETAHAICEHLRLMLSEASESPSHPSS